jgi:hypothetical protein
LAEFEKDAWPDLISPLTLHASAKEGALNVEISNEMTETEALEPQFSDEALEKTAGHEHLAMTLECSWHARPCH